MLELLIAVALPANDQPEPDEIDANAEIGRDNSAVE